MTEPAPTEPRADLPEADQDQLADTSAISDDTAEPQTLEQAKKLRSEARNLRARLHATETDLESAVTRLAASDRREAERHAATILVDPTDIWTAQPDMKAFYDDQYQDIVADKVIAAAKELAAAKPHLARPVSAPPPTDRPIEGLRGGAAPEVKPKTPTWSSAIRGTGG